MMQTANPSSYRYTEMYWNEKKKKWMGYNFYQNKQGQKYKLGPFEFKNQDPPTNQEIAKGGNSDKILRIRILN